MKYPSCPPHRARNRHPLRTRAESKKRAHGDGPAKQISEQAEPTQTAVRARTNETTRRNAGTGTNVPRVPSPANAGERYNALHRAPNAGRAPQPGTRPPRSKKRGRENERRERNAARENTGQPERTGGNGGGCPSRRIRHGTTFCPVPRPRGPGARRAAEPRKPCHLYLIMVTLKAENILQSTLQG